MLTLIAGGPGRGKTTLATSMPGHRVMHTDDLRALSWEDQKRQVAAWIRAAAIDAHANDTVIEGHRVLSGLIEVAVTNLPAPYELGHIRELIYVWGPTYCALTPQAQAIAARTDQRMRDVWSRLQAAGINVSHRSAPGPVQLY